MPAANTCDLLLVYKHIIIRACLKIFVLFLQGDSGGPLVINRFVKSTKNLVPDHEESVW